MSAPSPEFVAERFNSEAEAHIRSLFRSCPPDEFLVALARYVPATRDEERAFETFHGWALLDQGENPTALVHLTRALRRSRPTSEDRALLRGLVSELCLRLGDFRQAERCIHRALADLPSNEQGEHLRVGHLMNLARSYRRRGHVGHAVATHRRALSMIGPESTWWHPLTTNLGIALIAHGNLHEADAMVREHRKLAPHSPPTGREWMAVMMEAFVALHLGDLDRCDRLVAELTDAAHAAGERGQLMRLEVAAALARARGEWQRSEAMLVPALERSQFHGAHSDFVATFALGLAESLEGQGRFDEALEPAHLAIRAGSREDWLEWCRSLHALGRCLVGLGRHEEARRTFREVLGIHERCEFHLEHDRLCETLQRLGLSELGSSATSTRSVPARSASHPEPIHVRLRDGRDFLTCDPHLLETIQLASVSQLPALIEGETGTGKELVARLLHELGDHRSGPFVVVDCSSLPAELADSELFGAARGAYTGAHRDRAGLVTEADGGTLLLDELPELTLPLQAKLLRTLQDGTFRRVGESVVRHVRVRIVAATNRSVEELIRAGQLKTDLFYRLNGHRIRLEPLRRRRDEIQPLAERIAMSCGLAGLTPRAARELRAYDWPGNVRELEMTVRVAACHVSPGGRLDVAHLPPLLASPEEQGLTGDSLRAARAAWERAALLRALRESGGVVARAARSLGLTRQAYYKAMRRTGLNAEDVRGLRGSSPVTNDA